MVSMPPASSARASGTASAARSSTTTGMTGPRCHQVDGGLRVVGHGCTSACRAADPCRCRLSAKSTTRSVNARSPAISSPTMVGSVTSRRTADGHRRPGHRVAELIGAWVRQRDGLAGRIDRIDDVQRPSGDAERRPRCRRALRRAGGGGAQQPRPDLLGTVRRDLNRGVRQRGVVEARQHGLAVFGDVDSGRRNQRWRDVLGEQSPAHVGEHRVGDGVGDGPMPQPQPEVGQHRVCGVEHAQLQVFPRHDVIDQSSAHRRPCRCRAGEPVLDDPLPERFTDDRAVIADAGATFELGDVGVGGGRDDSVDHRRRERRGRPVERIAVEARRLGEVADQRLEQTSVVGQVVARDDGQRPRAGGRAAGDGARQHRGHRPGALGGEVGAHLGIVEAKAPGDGVAPVALLGDGQGHDVNVGIADPVDHGGRVGGGVERLAQCADHAGRRRSVAALHHRVQAVLWAQPLCGGAAALGESRYPPTGVAGVAHGVFGVDGLVCAVERPKAEMDLSDGQ